MTNSKQHEFMNAYEACHDRFLRYCSSLAYGKMDVQDLVQDVLLSAFEKFDQVQNKEQLLHYLIRAARNRSISLWRKRRIQVEITENHHERLKSQGVSAETILDINILYTNLDKLPAKQKEAVILFEISGFSMKEIAVIQKSTEGAVKTKVSRGRSKLTELLNDNNRHDIQRVLGVLKCVTL